MYVCTFEKELEKELEKETQAVPLNNPTLAQLIDRIVADPSSESLAAFNQQVLTLNAFIDCGEGICAQVGRWGGVPAGIVLACSVSPSVASFIPIGLAASYVASQGGQKLMQRQRFVAHDSSKTNLQAIVQAKGREITATLKTVLPITTKDE